MFVNILKGTHRNTTVTGIFPVVEPVKTTNKGFVIKVRTPKAPPFTVETPKIVMETMQDFHYCNKDGEAVDPAEIAQFNPVAQQIVANNEVHVDYEAEFLSSESDEDAMERIAGTFAMLNEVTDAASQGIVRGLVVSGPPGIGKSYGVEETLQKSNLFTTMAKGEEQFEIVSGAATPIALYQKLYFNRHKGFVTVFDDCDNILYDDVSLNLLKAALDSKKKRSLSWLADSRTLREEDVPNHFEFEGSIIFLTNVDFERTKISKVKDHLDAIVSRCHYLDLTINSQRDQVLRIKQIVREGMLKEYNFENGEEQVIVDYITDNANYLREISLRTVKKIADLVKVKPNDWHSMVEATVLRRDAKFKRLHEAKQKQQ